MENILIVLLLNCKAHFITKNKQTRCCELKDYSLESHRVKIRTSPLLKCHYAVTLSYRWHGRDGRPHVGEWIVPLHR